MSVEIKSQDGNKLTLEIEVDISGSMLEAEEKIQAACHVLGSLSTEKVSLPRETVGLIRRPSEEPVN